MRALKSQEVIFFSPDDVAAPFKEGETVLEVAEAQKLGIASSCGGMGTCGTCRIIVEAAPEGLPPRNEVEQEMAQDRGFQACERLACQVFALDGLKVRIPE